FLYQSGNDADRILISARLIHLFWGFLLIGSVYAVARETLGPSGGLVALILATFCPTLLAHAPLVTVDVPVAALQFLAVVSFHHWLKKPTVFYAGATGLLLGAALTSKFTSVAVFPIFAIMSWMTYLPVGTGPSGLQSQ